MEEVVERKVVPESLFIAGVVMNECLGLLLTLSLSLCVCM